MNPLQKAKTPFEKELAAELRAMKQQIANLRRQMTGMERDNRLLSVMSENAGRLRRVNEAEKKLQCIYNDMLLDHCPNLVFLFDTELRLRLATRSCLSVTPFDSVEDLNMCAPEHIFGKKMNPAWIDKIVAECREVMENRATCQYDDKILFIDGAGHMDAQVKISPVVDAENQTVLGVLVSLSDITELNVIKERAKEYSRSRSSFLAGMSHEIRMPVNAVKGLAELLMMTKLDDLQKTYVSDIIRSSNSLLGMINDIVDLSKIDADKIDIIKSEYSLGAMIKEVCAMISPHALEKNLELAVEIDPALPAKLYGDDSRLKQVMINILDNAVKHTEKGRITFKVNGERKGDREIRLDFTASDTGIGIRHDEIPTLFDVCSRTDPRLGRDVMGTGLDLAIGKKLMLAMDGDISVKSVYGKGSTFSFWLPQKIVMDAPLASVEHAGKKKALILDEGGRGKELASFLERLGVPHVTLEETIKQAAQGWEDASHCIYHDGYPATELGKLRGSMPEAAFVVIRDISRAPERPKYADLNVYTPVLLTDLAAALNSTRARVPSRGRQNPAEPDGNFKVRDAKAREDAASRFVEKESKSAPDFDLVKLLDDFGMHASDVMRELDGDLPAYIARLGRAEAALGDLARHLSELVRLEDWPRFSLVIGELKEMLHGIGARDCAVRAKKMEIASAEGNIPYVRQNFKSLMGNIYMLERKLDALVPLVMGKNTDGSALNDPEQICELLQDLQAALENKDIGSSSDLMEEVARCSFDHDLDMLLNSVRWAMEAGDLEEAAGYNITAVAFHKQRNAIS